MESILTPWIWCKEMLSYGAVWCCAVLYRPCVHSALHTPIRGIGGNRKAPERGQVGGGGGREFGWGDWGGDSEAFWGAGGAGGAWAYSLFPFPFGLVRIDLRGGCVVAEAGVWMTLTDKKFLSPRD